MLYGAFDQYQFEILDCPDPDGSDILDGGALARIDPHAWQRVIVVVETGRERHEPEEQFELCCPPLVRATWVI
jgi:hypothetical protein